MSDDRLSRIEETLQVLVGGQQEIRSDLDGLRAGLTDVRAGLAEQHHQMLVLHEETLDRIRALSFDPAPLRREFQAADASLREEVNQRLEPIETFIRTRTRRRR